MVCDHPVEAVAAVNQVAGRRAVEHPDEVVLPASTTSLADSSVEPA